MLLKRLTSFLTHLEYWGDWHGWGVDRGWEHRNQGSELIKGSLILLNTLWTPLGSPPMRCLEWLPVVPTTGLWASSKLCASPSPLWPTPCIPPYGWWVWTFTDNLQACAKSQLISAGLRESTHFRAPKENKGETLSTWPSFARLGEGI